MEISGDRTVRAASMLLQEKEVSKVMAPSMDSISNNIKQYIQKVETDGESTREQWRALGTRWPRWLPVGSRTLGSQRLSRSIGFPPLQNDSKCLPPAVPGLYLQICAPLNCMLLFGVALQRSSRTFRGTNS